MDTKPTDEPNSPEVSPTEPTTDSPATPTIETSATNTAEQAPTPPAPEQVIEPSSTESDADLGDAPTSETVTESTQSETSEGDEHPAAPVSPENSDDAPKAVTSKPKKSRKGLIIGIVLVLLLAAAGGAYAMYGRKKAPATSTPATTSKQSTSNEKTSTVAVDPQLQRFTNPTTGETWYDTYKPLPLQKFSDETYGPENKDDYAYYEVGKRGNNVIIAGQLSNRIGCPCTDLYEKAPDGTVTAILEPNANIPYTGSTDGVYAKSVKIDKTTHYDSLSVPKVLTLDDGDTLKQGESPDIGAPSKGNPAFVQPTATKNSSIDQKSLKKLGASELFERHISYMDTHLTAMSYYVTLPTKTSVGLIYQPIGTSFKETTWNNGYASEGNFAGLVRGCGSTSSSMTIGDNVSDADFIEAGKTNQGQKLYAFKDKNNALVQKAYSETMEFYKDEGTYKNLTVDQFMHDQGIFAFKAKSGHWLIFSSDKYAPFGGCAKPVVYLYPTAPTTVNVRVGADVKVSDPLYDAKKGWTVLAQPNGQLVSGGKTYGSLFWEGPGWGLYPGIASGTVVPRSQAEATMRRQLVEQGLNTQETQDFMDYWASRIPNKPYVRLTWFTTDEINQLAPLAISPKPNTIFRVFLDMDGFDQRISLQPQQLQKLNRRSGFTVIEWGGLSHTKLY